MSQGNEDLKPTSHFSLRESAIEATLEKIINNQRRADKKFEIFSDEVKSNIRDVRTSLETFSNEIKLDVDESLRNFIENIQLNIQEVKKETQQMREITEKTSDDFNSLKLEMKTDFEIFKDDINKDVKTFKSDIDARNDGLAETVKNSNAMAEAKLLLTNETVVHVQSSVNDLEGFRTEIDSDLTRIKRDIDTELPQLRNQCDRVEGDVMKLWDEVSAVNSAFTSCDRKTSEKIECVQKDLLNLTSSMECHKHETANQLADVGVSVDPQLRGTVDAVGTFHVNFQAVTDDLEVKVQKLHENQALMNSNFDRVEVEQVSLKAQIEDIGLDTGRDLNRLSGRFETNLQQLHQRVDVVNVPLQEDLTAIRENLGHLAVDVDLMKSEMLHIQQTEQRNPPKSDLDRNPDFASAREHLESSIQQYLNLRKERDVQMEEYRKQDSERRKKIQRMTVESDKFLVKAKEQHERTVAFQDEYYDRMSTEVLEEVRSSAQRRKSKFGINYSMPKSVLSGFEWTRLDLKALTVPEATAQCNTEDEDQTCPKQYSQPRLYSQGRSQFTPCPNRKWVQASRNSKCSTPTVDEVTNRLQATLDMNVKDGCYIGSRHKQNTGKTNTGTLPFQDCELSAVTSDKDDQVQQSGHHVSGEFNKHESRAHERSRDSRSFRIPKLSFDGEYWKGFITQFETVAERLAWSEADKLDAFSLALKKEAAEYYSILPDNKRTDFTWLKGKFEEYYEDLDPPSSVRWELLSVEQRENETLERYLARLQKMILRAYPDTQTRQLSNPMFVDTFLKGCRDKAAALTACDKNPETIEEAYKYVKLSGQRRKAIFGKKNIVRTVSKHYDPAFASSSDSDQSTSSPKRKYCVQGIQRLPNSNQNQVSTDKGKSLSEAGLLLKGLERIENMMRSGMPCVNSPRRNYSCYECGEPGHFAKDCPRRRYPYTGSPGGRDNTWQYSNSSPGKTGNSRFPGKEVNKYSTDTFRRSHETYWGPRGNNPKNEYFENGGGNSQENKAGTSPKSSIRRQGTPPRKGLVSGSPSVKFAPLNT